MRTEEARDIIIASAVLAFVFSYEGINFGRLLANAPLAVFGVVTGFILHELAHRFFARRYGAFAEFRAWKEGLLLAVALTLITNGAFVFAAPGAVMIYPRANLWGHSTALTSRKMGIIGISGPIVNIILASAFLITDIYYPSQLFGFAARINIWLALFNMIPLTPLDGSKVFYWNKAIWLVTFLAILAIFIIL
jgi:Zn-dependent protease